MTNESGTSGVFDSNNNLCINNDVACVVFEANLDDIEKQKFTKDILKGTNLPVIINEKADQI